MTLAAARNPRRRQPLRRLTRSRRYSDSNSQGPTSERRKIVFQSSSLATGFWVVLAVVAASNSSCDSDDEKSAAGASGSSSAGTGGALGSAGAAGSAGSAGSAGASGTGGSSSGGSSSGGTAGSSSGGTAGTSMGGSAGSSSGGSSGSPPDSGNPLECRGCSAGQVPVNVWRGVGQGDPFCTCSSSNPCVDRALDCSCAQSLCTNYQTTTCNVTGNTLFCTNN
jgi:hypothetical protein